ncbi:hypothetical protein Mmc1_3542 [Magnetococcus marinus MC-1]|uniref:Zinc resistance-associated protein n=1 Tax=Magnetococcus marinus (strain ATCC BAA-1437 / JCM 17883 / MC-1) TaxID=156889 RepID=A0LDI4_MAGMM|nr:periplasmic heavy metal sensor [Magnetococcus marinus]ABK46027.1 hypothetical protein Mmc1_3542 [Magnetococcus marinus MC-1]
MRTFPRWLVVVMFGSVALNLFFVGMLGVSYWRCGPLYLAMHGSLSSNPYRMGLAMQNLDDQAREKLTPIMQVHMPTMDNSLRQLRVKKAEVHQLLITDPVDQVALEQAFRELRLQAQQAQESVHRMMMQAAATLSPEARQQMFEFKGRGHHPRGQRGGGRCDGPGKSSPVQ